MKLLEPYREELLRLARENGVARLRVFGSVARNEERPDSDVDFLVDVAPRATLLTIGGFQYYAERLLQRPVQVITTGGLYHLLKDSILREARDL